MNWYKLSQSIIDQAVPDPSQPIPDSVRDEYDYLADDIFSGLYYIDYEDLIKFHRLEHLISSLINRGKAKGYTGAYTENSTAFSKLKEKFIDLTDEIIDTMVNGLRSWLGQVTFLLGEGAFDEESGQRHEDAVERVERVLKILEDSLTDPNILARSAAITLGLGVMHTSGRMAHYFGLDDDELDSLNHLDTSKWDAELSKIAFNGGTGKKGFNLSAKKD